MFSSFLDPFERFAPCSEDSLVSFERFAPCSQILYSLSSGLLLVLKSSKLFRAVCRLFSNSLVLFERFAPCSRSLESFSSGLLLVLQFPSLFRARFDFCFQRPESFSVSFDWFAPFSEFLFFSFEQFTEFLISLVDVELFAPCSRIL